MKMKELLESDDKKYVIIGNPGRSQPSALYPKTEHPKLYTEKDAKEIVDELNDKPKITYGVLPSSVYWHYKPIDKALDYVSGPKAASSIRALKPFDEVDPNHRPAGPDLNSWGAGPAKNRF